MTTRRFITCIALVAAITGTALGLNVGAAHAEPAGGLFDGTTIELAQDAQAFISDKLKTSRSIGGNIPWPVIVDLNNKFELADLQEKRDIDTLGVLQAIAARTFAYFGISRSKTACLTGAMVAAYANQHQVTDAISKREMLYALAYMQFEKPNAKIEEAIMATTMMDYPEGVAAYNTGVTQGPQACNTRKPATLFV